VLSYSGRLRWNVRHRRLVDCCQKQSSTDHQYETTGRHDASQASARRTTVAPLVDAGYSSLSSAERLAVVASHEQMLTALRRIISRYDSDDADTQLLYEWRRLAVVVDKILFWIFLVATVGSTLLTLVVIPVARWL